MASLFRELFDQLASCILSLFNRENPEDSPDQDHGSVDNLSAVRVTAAASPGGPSVTNTWTQTVWTVEIVGNVVVSVPGDMTGLSMPESLGPPMLDLTDPAMVTDASLEDSDMEADRSGEMLEGWEMEQLPSFRLRPVTRPAPRMPGLDAALAVLDDIVAAAVIDVEDTDRPVLEPLLLLEEEVVDWAEQEGSAGASKVAEALDNLDSAGDCCLGLADNRA